jgi:WD40 repeat protein
MLTVRCNHTATLLPNGKVLVAGGDMTGTAELYDPATGNWTATGAMSTARSHHAAVLLNNGKVLVVGGGRKTEWIASPETELYDPATGKWRLTGALHTGSFFFTTATLLPDGKVLIAGGHSPNGPISSTEIYDPEYDKETPLR